MTSQQIITKAILSYQMSNLFRCFCQILLAVQIAVTISTSACALEFLIGDERASTDFANYEAGLIRLALEKADGDHSVEFADTGGANQSRLLESLANGTANFHIMYSGIDRERFEKLAVVPIPLQRGLLGHRILIVSDDSRDDVAAVRTFADLKDLTIGSGIGWPDTEILERAGLNVEKADYEDLFKMVDFGRVHGFARGVAEPFAELEVRKDQLPGLKIDDTILIVYPFDVFLYLNKADTERFEIIRQGLERAYADGSFLAYFNNHPRIRDVFERARIDERIRFDIPNPLLPAEINAIPDRYWHGRQLSMGTEGKVILD